MFFKRIYLVFIVAVLLSGCGFQEKIGGSKPSRGRDAGIEVDVVYKKDNSKTPSWVPGNEGAGTPWNGSLYIGRSIDGKTFISEKLFVQHAGVPDLLYTQDGRVIAVFQYFSYEHEDLFDKIAYSISEDGGETWSKVKKIDLGPKYDEGPNPVDPTLVQLKDGRYRLYFTYQEHGSAYPTLYSSISDKIDGMFKDEGEQFSTKAELLDPAVVFFKNKWHHYTVNHGGSGAIHSVSEDGLNFKAQENILSDFQFLGGAIEDRGKLRFYGSKNGVILAESSDGYTFTKIRENIVRGADPGIAKLPGGEYLMVYSRQ